MKKIFSLFILILSFALVSCGVNDLSHEKASVDFTIPVTNLILLRNSAVRSVETDENSIDEQTDIMKFVVQLVNENGYCNTQIRTVDLTNLADQLSFSFNNIEPGTYKIIADMFVGDIQIEWISTGEKTINVVAGRENPVILPVKSVYGNYSGYTYPEYFDIEFSYEKAGQTVTQKASVSDFFGDYEQDSETGEWEFVEAKYEVVNVRDMPSFRDRTDETDVWHAFKSLDYVLNENFHFIYGYSVKAVKEESVYDETTGEYDSEKIEFLFEDGRINILDKLKETTDHMFLEISQTANDDSVVFRLVPGELRIPGCPVMEEKEPEENQEENPEENPEENQGGNTSEDEDPEENHGGNTSEEVEPEETVFVEEQSGEIIINESKLSFEPWNVSETQSTVRYMTTVPLSSILEGKHLSDGDTVVFVLTTGGENTSDIFSQYGVSQFYYQLQEDNWKTTYEEDDEGLFANNNCINFDVRPNGDYTFVMPLNLIQDAEDYRNLQMFFDCPKGTDDEELELNCSVKYSIFPAVQKAFVFGVGKNWSKSKDSDPEYRYEINNQLRSINGEPLDLGEGDTVKVYLQGKIRTYKNDAFERIDDNTLFTAELYDNAYYEGSSFHALSIDKLDGDIPNSANVKQLAMGRDGGLAAYGQFVFSPIAEPYKPKKDENFKNDFRFQCYTLCENPEVLLVVTDYYFTNQVTKKSN